MHLQTKTINGSTQTIPAPIQIKHTGNTTGRRQTKTSGGRDSTQPRHVINNTKVQQGVQKTPKRKSHLDRGRDRGYGSICFATAKSALQIKHMGFGPSLLDSNFTVHSSWKF